MDIDDIHRVFIIGAGTMGRRIGLRCAAEGYEVTVYDVSSDALKKADELMHAEAAEQVDQKRLTREASVGALSRIRYSNNPEDAANADLVSESIFEDPDAKAKVFAQFAKICPPRTVLTTNTSTLLPSMYASATGRPEQFAALHFYGVWDANLADIMPHPGTSPGTVEVLKAFTERIGQVPLVFKKEKPAYICNALFGALNLAAFRLVVDGSASVEDVDRAAILHLGMRTGPFGICDTDGLDLIFNNFRRAAEVNPEPKIQAITVWLKSRYVDKGWLGKKSGRGFYTWPDPAFGHPDFLKGGTNSSAIRSLDERTKEERRLESIGAVLSNALYGPALEAAVYGFASVEDIDRAAMIFPGLRMGPFGMMDCVGLDVIIGDAEKAAKANPEWQAAVDWLKREYVNKGWLGKKSGRGFYTWPNPAYERPGFLTGES